MKSILKKIAGVAVAAVLVLGMFSCSNGIDYPVKQTVATPVFSVVSGAVNSGTEVTISCATDGAKIYYTTDGSDPTASSTEYTAAISVTAAVTLKAIAVKSGMNDSAVASASYTIKGTVATPAFSPASGAVNSGTKVTISCATEGAKIYYTTDENEPTAESSEYTGAAISITEAVTLKAIAVKDGMNNSAVASASYTIKGTVASPAFSVASGAVNSGTKVTISCVTEGAKIYYTTDDSDPTASSSEYTEEISVTPPMTLKAIAVKDGMNDSAVASASYTIKGTVATPAFSPDSGAVNSGTSVKISCSTDGAKIYYTTDGNEPTAESTEYTEEISVTPPMTLKAIAVKGGMNDSAVASASYTIKGTVATPVFSVASGAVDSGTSVTITCATEGAKIYYTTDENEPTAANTEYTDAISITEAVTLKAIAVKDDMNDSAVASASYLIIPTKTTCVPGDFVLKDGTMLPKDITLTKIQKSNVAAVVVRAATNNKPALVVGIVHYYFVWCEKSAVGYNTNITALQGSITSGYMDGSDGWEKLKSACYDSSDYNKYPAWNYSNSYAWKNDLTGDLATGWYLPTVAELYTIYQNKKAVDASLKKAGGKQFGKDGYWSCCQSRSKSSEAWAVYFGGSWGGQSKSNNPLYVCSVLALY